jgi:hypothetical protein
MHVYEMNTTEKRGLEMPCFTVRFVVERHDAPTISVLADASSAIIALAVAVGVQSLGSSVPRGS